MGMFDYVSGVELNCVNCSKPLNNWQTKDGDCALVTVPFWRVETFYNYCSGCGTRHTYKLKENVRRSIDDYELVVAKNDSKSTISVGDYLPFGHPEE